MPTRQELKEEAKQLVNNKTTAEMFVPLLIYIAISALISGVTAVVYITFLLAPLAEFIYIRWLMNFVRYDNVKLDEYFKTLSDPNKDVEYVLTSFLRSIFMFLWSLLFVIPGIVYCYSTAMVPYLLSEKQNFKYSECLKLSKDMMNGHKMELFVLELSFIGWAILICLTCGILAIWKGPYIATTKELFYEHLKVEYNKEHPGTFEDLSQEKVEDEFIVDACSEETFDDDLFDK